MDIPRDQVLIFSSAERGYLIDAIMVFMKQVEKTWSFDQYRELMILLEHLMRTNEGTRPEHQLLGKQVTVILNHDDEHAVSRGQLLGFGEGGDIEILEDDGMIHYCWPALEVRERDEEQRSDYRREGQDRPVPGAEAGSPQVPCLRNPGRSDHPDPASHCEDPQDPAA